jgi:hydrogenase large subunit
MSTITLGPVTRIEGHLDVALTVGNVGGKQQVTDAKSTGTMFRGFETILQGHQPLDAVHLTQRICGVCPISHGMASSLALEKALGGVPPANGRIVRNLILGANFLQSHVLHFYHLAALDYIDTTGILDISPWTPRYVTADMVKGSAASTFAQHYVQALAIRRQAHQMGAILGGKLPCSPVFIPGGASQPVTAQKVTDFRTLLTTIRTFISNVMVPDVQQIAALYPQYAQIGKGCGNLLAYGVFDQDNAGTTKLLARGRLTNGAVTTVDPAQITEYVKYSYYTPASGAKNPSVGVTQPSVGKPGAYSWLKSPRYLNTVHEVGPLARMWVNGDYRKGISVIDRLAARVLEAQKIANAMDGWLSQLTVGASYTRTLVKATGTGIGLTEAPRGALGHWLTIAASKISRYQIVTPTNWNASPMDDYGKKGPMEQALIGTPVADLTKPIEVLRVIHSFDPCMSCSVHMVTPSGESKRFVVEG